MTIQEVLNEIAGERLCADDHKNDQRCHGCTAHLVRHEMANDLAPKVEAALRETALEMAELIAGSVIKSLITERELKRCVTAGIAKLGETT